MHPWVAGISLIWHAHVVKTLPGVPPMCICAIIRRCWPCDLCKGPGHDQQACAAPVLLSGVQAMRQQWEGQQWQSNITPLGLGPQGWMGQPYPMRMAPAGPLQMSPMAPRQNLQGIFIVAICSVWLLTMFVGEDWEQKVCKPLPGTCGFYNFNQLCADADQCLHHCTVLQYVLQTLMADGATR